MRPASAAGEPVSPVDYFDACHPADLPRIDRECRRAHLARFASLDPGKGFLFVNMHPRAVLADAALAADLRAELRLHGLAPFRVCIEIQEGDCGDEARLAQAAAAYRAIGMKVAIDHFGVARSDFGRVAAIGPDFVKVDRPLFAEALGSAKERLLLHSVIGLLHDAGAKVIAQGIEDAPQALFAIEAGADYVQGCFFGGPRAALASDPLTAQMLARLKKLAGPGEWGADPEDAGTERSSLARLLEAGRARAMPG